MEFKIVYILFTFKAVRFKMSKERKIMKSMKQEI